MKHLALIIVLSFGFVTCAMAQQADSDTSDPVVETLHTISQMKSLDKVEMKRLLSQPSIHSNETMIQWIRCLWVLQDQAEGVRTPIKGRYYEVMWLALLDLFSRDDPALDRSLVFLLDDLRMDGGGRLGFENHLEARRKRLGIPLKPKK